MQNELSLSVGLKLSPLLAIYCREDDALAIADLHLGYEAELQAEHVAMPRFQLGPMLARLDKLLKRFDPAMVIVNGDLKHGFSGNRGQEWDEVEEILDRLEGREVVAVRGNHDNYLRTILSRRGIALKDSYPVAGGRVVFRHGHAKARMGKAFTVFGHEHPVVRFRDDVGAQVQMPCFLCDEANRFLVMPAFSPLASGTNVISPEASFLNPNLGSLDISQARVIAVHETLMDFGTVAGLRGLGRGDADARAVKCRGEG